MTKVVQYHGAKHEWCLSFSSKTSDIFQGFFENVNGFPVNTTAAENTNFSNIPDLTKRFKKYLIFF